MPNFNDIAKKKLAEVEKPPLPPQGHFRWQVSKIPAMTTSGDKKWEIVNFPVRAVEAMEDVDPDELAAVGGVEKIVNRIGFMFNTEDETEFERTEYRLRVFLEEHLKCADASQSIAEGMNNSLNQQFIAPIEWVKDKKDDSTFHANLGKTAPVE